MRTIQRRVRSKCWTHDLGGWRHLRELRKRRPRRRQPINPWATIDHDRDVRRLWNRTCRDHADLRDMFPDDGEFLDALKEREMGAGE